MPSLIRLKLAAVLLAFLLSGCQSLGGSGVISSSAPAEISGAAASAIAGDMVSRLSEQIGPGTATIVLKQDGSPFGQSLETALKSWGYAVVTSQQNDGKAQLVPVAYVVEPFEGNILARLSTRNIDIGRVYAISAKGATPTSPLSVMQRG